VTKEKEGVGRISIQTEKPFQSTFLNGEDLLGFGQFYQKKLKKNILK